MTVFVRLLYQSSNDHLNRTAGRYHPYITLIRIKHK